MKKKKVAEPGTLGWRLLKARTEVAKIKQADLEERSGVSQRTISKIERGDQAGSTQVAQLAGACGVKVEWLATGSGEMVPGDAGHRVEEQRASYVSDAALDIARAWDQLSAVSQDHVRRQIELLRGADDSSGRRRAVQHDVEIRRGALRPAARSKSKKAPG